MNDNFIRKWCHSCETAWNVCLQEKKKEKACMAYHSRKSQITKSVTFEKEISKRCDWAHRFLVLYYWTDINNDLTVHRTWTIMKTKNNATWKKKKKLRNKNSCGYQTKSEKRAQPTCNNLRESQLDTQSEKININKPVDTTPK